MQISTSSFLARAATAACCLMISSALQTHAQPAPQAMPHANEVPPASPPAKKAPSNWTQFSQVPPPSPAMNQAPPSWAQFSQVPPPSPQAGGARATTAFEAKKTLLQNAGALTFKPLQPPPLPLTPQKQRELEELLRKYLADGITPVEYHAQRAKILAAP